MIPGMLFLGYFDLSRRFLCCLQYTQGPMYAQILSAALHLILCIFWVRSSGLDVTGLGLATMIAYLVQWMLTDFYGVLEPGIRAAIQWPTRDAWRGWSEYIAISAGSTVMMLAEGWAFNILGVLAGLISVTDQAVNAILFHLIAVMIRVPIGIQSACSAIIGEQIGANNVPLAKEYFRVMSVTILILMLVIQGLVYGFRVDIVRIFTTDAAVRELAEKSVYIVVLSFAPDMIQGSLQGVIRALGIQNRASYYALACFYLLGIPFAVLFTFTFHMGVVGLWLGLALGITAVAVIYVALVLYTDWQEVADEALKRTAMEQAALALHDVASYDSAVSDLHSNAHYINL